MDKKRPENEQSQPLDMADLERVTGGTDGQPGPAADPNSYNVPGGVATASDA